MSERRHPKYGLHRFLECLTRFSERYLARCFRTLAAASLVCTTAAFTLVAASEQEVVLAGWWQEMQAWIKDRKFQVVVIALVVQTASVFLAWLSSKWHPFDEAKLRRVLDRVVALHFADRDSNHEYRATLFKARKTWFAGRWLGAVAHSGSSHAREVYSIDTEVREYNTGWVGDCWWQRDKTVPKNLPPPETRPDEYARRSLLDEREMNNIKTLPRVLLATPIKVGGPFPWGVLLLGTTKPHASSSATNDDEADHQNRLQFSAVSIEALVTP